MNKCKISLRGVTSPRILKRDFDGLPEDIMTHLVLSARSLPKLALTSPISTEYDTIIKVIHKGADLLAKTYAK